MRKLITALSGIATALFCVQILAQDIPDTIAVTSSIFDHHGTVPEENSAYGDNTFPVFSSTFGRVGLSPYTEDEDA